MQWPSRKRELRAWPGPFLFLESIGRSLGANLAPVARQSTRSCARRPSPTIALQARLNSNRRPLAIAARSAILASRAAAPNVAATSAMASRPEIAHLQPLVAGRRLVMGATSSCAALIGVNRAEIGE